VKKGKDGEHRRLSENELKSFLNASLTSLKYLTTIYDQGHSPIVFLMATEVIKILTDNQVAVQLRKGRNFPSPPVQEQAGNLLAFQKLIVARIDSDSVTCVPYCQLPGQEPSVMLPFTDWWSKEIIYTASAAIPGGEPGMIPVNDSPSIPWEKRQRATRLSLTTLLRKKLGSHQDSDFPTLLDEVDEAASWMNVRIKTEDAFLDTADGSLNWVVRPLAASMRQIAYEVLSAYSDIQEAST
jgi:hypothetical protein